MSEKKKSLEQLMFVSGSVYRLLRYEAQKRGVRWTALMVLKDLDLLGPSSQQVLVEIEQVTKPTMTVLLKQMEQRGWIERYVNPDRARENVVTITAQGRTYLRDEGEHLRRSLEAVLEGVTGKELLQLGQGLEPVVRVLANNVGLGNS